MHRDRSLISLLLCIAVFASLFSGFAASAAPLKVHPAICLDKPANVTLDSVQQQPALDCCLPVKEKPASVSSDSLSAPSPSGFDCCAPTSKLPVQAKAQIGSNPLSADDCCVVIPIRGKLQLGSAPAAPCGPVDTSCGITYPVGSVVGNMPFDQAAYYAPGKLATGVTINAGTYWVTGFGKADNGDGFYQIVVACQYLFVPQIDIVPSYQSPWSGQPLPTTPPVEQ